MNNPPPLYRLNGGKVEGDYSLLIAHYSLQYMAAGQGFEPR